MNLQGGSSARAGDVDATVSKRGVNSITPESVKPEVFTVPILSLEGGASPRLKGEDKAHIARLAETDAQLPPILVDRRTMRIIDGMHRAMAASLKGCETIDVIFFDGDDADGFLRAVQENIAHGLPLSQADRKAAAQRIISSHPHMSDRAIGESTGLSGKTIAAIRKRASADLPELHARMGKDGKLRPVDSGEGRRRAAEILAIRPDASLRDVAREAGVSAGTVRDVRRRFIGGEPPASLGFAGDSAATPSNESAVAPPAPRDLPRADPCATVQRLMHDPSLRSNELGKSMLRLLHINAVGAGQLPLVAPAVPAHCLAIVTELARGYAAMWNDFAQDLERRAHITGPGFSSGVAR